MGGGLRYVLHFFASSALLLAGVSVHDVEASSCQHVIIHKKVGVTVEFSACLPEEEVSSASWTYKGLKLTDKYSILADKDGVLSGNHQFQGRLDLNSTNLSLTVRRLTLQDSGDFSFSSADRNDDQRDTVTVTLHVHEPITKEPVINLTSTWHTLNESCTFLLDCGTTSDNSVTYDWTVMNQNIAGSRLQYVIKPGDTEFTCTVSNVVSEKSTSVAVNCNNTTTGSVNKGPSSFALVLLVVGPVIVIILITLLLLFFLKSKGPCFNRVTQSETVNQSETPQQVYSTLLHGDGCVYDTLTGSEGAGTGGGCDYEPMRGSEVVGTGGGLVSE